MKRAIFFAALLLGARPCCAQTAAPVPPGPAAADPRPAIERTEKNLSLLKEKYSEVPAERLAKLAPELERFNAQVREALGESILAEVAAREQAAENAARGEAAIKLLQNFRGALQVYYSELGGKYPASPRELLRDGSGAAPELLLPGHEKTSAITIIDSRKYDKDISKAVKNTGGWLYFAEPKSAYYGLLLLDSDHLSHEGVKFFEY